MEVFGIEFMHFAKAHFCEWLIIFKPLENSKSANEFLNKKEKNE